MYLCGFSNRENNEVTVDITFHCLLFLQLHFTENSSSCCGTRLADPYSWFSGRCVWPGQTNKGIPVSETWVLTLCVCNPKCPASEDCQYWSTWAEIRYLWNVVRWSKVFCVPSTPLAALQGDQEAKGLSSCQMETYKEERACTCWIWAAAKYGFWIQSCCSLKGPLGII